MVQAERGARTQTRLAQTWFDFDSYDITGRCAVDPVFGTLSGFDGLLAAAHAHRLRVLAGSGPTTPPTGTRGSFEPGQPAAGLVCEG